jgi:1-aminocyclopropane-1-carboxylate deaminase
LLFKNGFENNKSKTDASRMMLQLNPIRTDAVSIYKSHTTVDVLRLDLIHPVVSGNKWFKLKEYIAEAQRLKKTTLLTYGGPFSNHIIATAATAASFGFNSIGIIKGYQPKTLSHTLQEAIKYGMQIHFAPTDSTAADILSSFNPAEIYTVPMGGYGLHGKEGAKTILGETEFQQYDYILCAVGTGTMLAGLVEAAFPHQQVIGISSMKNNHSLETEIKALLAQDRQNNFRLNHAYHFGGYAKHTPQLIQFMNRWFIDTNIPTDFVYTAKLFFGIDDLIQQGFFHEQSKLLIIHSGGLQGNISLAKGTLIF